MSYVSIISGVAARVKYLIPELTDSQRLLLQRMDSITKSLKSADDETKRSKQFVKLEKLVVSLSNDVVDAVELKILLSSKPKPKPKFPSLFRRSSVPPNSNGNGNGTPDLESLTSELIRLQYLVEYVSREPRSRSVTATISPPRLSQGGAGGDEAGNSVEREVREGLNGKGAVVCVYGGGGMGKTSLARKVLEEEAKSRAVGSFRGLAWVRVKRGCEPRRVFEDMLRQLSTAKDKAYIKDMEDEIEMIQQILMIQQGTRCLLVLDDVCALHDWNSIRVALLVGRSTKSKTLITTSNWELANLLKSKAQVYVMPRLHGPQISNILKDKANFDHQEVDAYGEIISELCGGSPLLCIILGKCFKRADEIARDQLVDEYYEKKINRGENGALDACYRLLPDDLKPCFNYMALFPEGHVIQADKLHLLWEAEGIMPPEYSRTKITNILLLQSAVRDIIEKLASRKLVKVEEDKASLTRMYKSCRLHHLIRNFCIFKALHEEFFNILHFESRDHSQMTTKKTITPSSSSSSSSSSSTSFTRLAIYLANYREGDAIITFTAKKIRSLLIFDASPLPQKSAWPSEISDIKEMSGLRVVDFNGVDFRASCNKVLRGIGKLEFLRYLSFRGCWLETFPSSITKLLFIETLDLRVHDDCVMFIPNILTHMTTRLTNIYFPLLYKTQPNTKLQLCDLRSLEILVNFSTEVCNVNDLYWLKNLQVLAAIISQGNHRDFADIVEYSCRPEATLQKSSFVVKNFNHSVERAAVLKRLLECPSIHSLHIQGNIKQLPEMSANLSEIVLDGSELEEGPTDVLRRLKNLRSLVLANYAFVGEKISMVFARKYFPYLRSLKLQNMQNLEKLVFHKGSVPKLSSLVVEKCGNMKQVLMPTALDSRLHAAQRKKGDDVYMLDLTPIII